MEQIKLNIKKANKLSKNLERVEDTLSLLIKSQESTWNNKKENIINNLRFLRVSSEICTWSQSSDCSKELFNDTDFLNKIAVTLIPLFEERMKEINLEIKELIKY